VAGTPWCSGLANASRQLSAVATYVHVGHVTEGAGPASVRVIGRIGPNLWGVTCVFTASDRPTMSGEMVTMLRRMALIAVVVVTAFAVVAVPSAAAAPGYCVGWARGIEWGSQPKAISPTTAGQLTNIRAGRHDCYDRLVFDIRGNADGYVVTYVDEVHEDATGNVVPLRGGAKLQVAVWSPAYDADGNPTYTFADRTELVDVTGYATFRQVAWANSWEGQSTVGLGVRARLPFRVFTLPGRIVVDVAHQW
jgi:hypothetical protein